MTAIAKTIWLIEAHLFEPVTLDQMAAHAGVSRFHLSRSFSVATGRSISGYIRGRRLSEAAKRLAGGEPHLLSLALATGYSSHEAFTRAFHDQFGRTPDEVRRQRSLENLKLVEPLPMDDLANVRIEPPVIEKHPRLLLAGLRRHQRMSDPNLLPLQWQDFQQHLGHIPGAVGTGTFGVVGNVAANGDDYDYYTLAEVDGRHEAPSDLTQIQILAQRLQRFVHHGHISMIRSTIGAIFDRYPATQGQTSEGTFDFIEFYGADFDPSRGLGTIEIWVPSA